VDCEQGERQFGTGKAGLTPHEPGRDRHHQVQTTPHRAKDPVRGIPGGLDEVCVPAWDLGCGGQAANASGGEADQDDDGEADPAGCLVHGH